MTTFGARLEARRSALGLTQEQLATKSGVTRVGISKIELDITKNARADTLFALAKALKCRPQWLLEGSGPMTTDEASEPNVIAGPPIHQFVPVLNYVQAGSWTEIVDQDEVEMFPCPVKCPPGTFGLRIRGNSMLPRFENDDLIFIDPTQITPDSGKFVVAQLDDSNEATFKQLEVIDGKRFLRALNPDYPPEMRYVKINGNCHIVGTVISHVKPV
ncbi:LexA family protein [Photobacterium toruni]|uniref:LexA family protein n=1 Tax=Photobacterium toruni TaxID=1935446 RepID=UPI00210F620A|nr:S24 family peptidase [Photobacterium toruni]